ncbi:MAG TPA: hypothetical protein VET65_00055 [Candidatus Limnocylindrales bacterium]|nr:hypothetical protein [Candidatus Limnocylindrales bacterium]
MAREAPTMQPLLDFLRRLERSNLDYSLERSSDDSLTVLVKIPGERWEVQFLEDGSVAIEKFLSDGTTHGEKELENLFVDVVD